MSANKAKAKTKSPSVTVIVEEDEEEEIEATKTKPYDNLLISILVFIGCFGWPVGVILSCIARHANSKENYSKGDCYGKVALYTNILAMACGVVGYLIIMIHFELL